MSNKLRILIVDDHGNLHDVVAPYLKQRYDVFHEQDHRLVLDLIETQKYGVVLVDENLDSGQSGIELVRLIQAKHSHLEVILFDEEKIDVPTPLPDDTFRFFRRPIIPEVLALNIELAATKGRNVKKRNEALLTLFEISNNLRNIYSEDEIIKTAVASASTLMDSISEKTGYFSHLAIKKDNYLYFYEQYHPKEVWEILLNATQGKINLKKTQNNSIGIAGRTVNLGYSQRINDVQQDPDYIKFNEEIGSQVSVLIRVKGKIFGVLSIEHPDNAFTEQDEQTVQTLADITSVLIEKAQRYKHEQKQARALRAMNTIGQSIISDLTLSEDDILREGVERAKDLMNIGSDSSQYLSHLALLKDNFLTFHIEHHPSSVYQYLKKAVDAKIDIETRQNTDKAIGIIGKAALTHTTICENNVTGNEDYIEISPSTNSQLAVHIYLTNKEVFGVLNIEHPEKDAFDEDDRQILELFVEYLKIAINNARLYRQENRESLVQKILYSYSRTLNYNDTLQETVQRLADYALKLRDNSGYPPNEFCHVTFLEGRFLRTQVINQSSLRQTYQELDKQEINIDQSSKIGITGRAAKDRRTQIVNYHIKSDKDYIELDPRTQAQISVPLIVERQVIGVLSIESHQENAFSDEDRSDIELLAELGAIAIYNSRLHGEFSKLTEKRVEALDVGTEQARIQAGWGFKVATGLFIISTIVILTVFTFAIFGKVTLSANIASAITIIEILIGSIAAYNYRLNKRYDDTYHRRLKQIEDFQLLMGECDKLPTLSERARCRENLIIATIELWLKVKPSTENSITVEAHPSGEIN